MKSETSIPLVAAGVFLLLVGLAVSADAQVCGNGIVESGEQCDDGNTDSGDCCAAACAFEAVYADCLHDLAGPCVHSPEGFCDGSGRCLAGENKQVMCGRHGFGATLAVRDEAATNHDRMRWNLRPGRWVRINERFIPEFGDPTVDTDYTFCLYEMHESLSLVKAVRYERTIPAGGAWRPASRGWVYRAVAPSGKSEGMIKLVVSNRARFQVRGVFAELPGPIDSSRYLGAMGVALIGSEGRCFLHKAGQIVGPTPGINTPEQYRFGTRPYLND